jgi:hypothetical protein
MFVKVSEELMAYIFRVEEQATQERVEVGDKLSLASSGFNSEDGGNQFLRNVGLSPNYMVLQPRRPYSS